MVSEDIEGAIVQGCNALDALLVSTTESNEACSELADLRFKLGITSSKLS
jgi:hypothetical protein